MTFYRYYADKEALILAILQAEESEFMQDLAQITADKASAREKAVRRVRLLPSLVYLPETFHGCMFTRALFEYGASSPAIREQCSRFKSLLWQFFRDILLQVLKPEPAERVAMMMVMPHRWRHRRPAGRVRRMPGDPARVTAWSAAKALFAQRGGTL